MSVETTDLVKFKYPFSLPTKDFKGTETKELTVSVIHKASKSNHYIRGSYAGAYSSEKAYFMVNIPKYLLEYVKGKLKQYTKDNIGIEGHYDNGSAIYKERHNFTSFVRCEKMTEVVEAMNTITYEALHIKEFEDLEKHNRVIFVHSDHEFKLTKDDYNFGLMGNNIDLNFQFFVAYKVEKKKNMIKNYWQEEGSSDDKVYEYYAIGQAPSSYGSKKRLPLLEADKLKRFTQIPWTVKREEFFIEIEQKIKFVADKINNFVSDVNTKNIDFMIERKNTLELEDKR
jgi:hypothetical protein